MGTCYAAAGHGGWTNIGLLCTVTTYVDITSGLLVAERMFVTMYCLESTDLIQSIWSGYAPNVVITRTHYSCGDVYTATVAPLVDIIEQLPQASLTDGLIL